MTTTTIDKAYILKLPDELLEKILRPLAQIVLQYSQNHHEIYKEARALALVCRRFNQVVTPFLYSALHLHCDTPRWPRFPPQAWKRLHRTLKDNPSLWPMCRELRIEYYDARDSNNTSAVTSNLYAALDLATWLSETRSLRVTGHGGPTAFADAWSIISRALEHMPNLIELGFYDWDERNTPLLPLISGLHGLGSASDIRTLDLSGIGVAGMRETVNSLQGLEGTASFTELKVFGFLQTPEVLAGLVAWPENLERFSFRFSYRPDYAEMGLHEDWSLATMREVLESQKANLRSILISHICQQGELDKFDLSDFTRLEDLSLSHGTTGDDMTFVGNLVAPHLRSFTWDLALEDQQCGETLDHFDQAHEDWLRELAKVAISRKCGLRKITIRFTPETWFRHSDTEDPLKYPWDRMDSIAQDIKPEGIELTYNPPTISKDEYMETLREQKNELEWMPVWLASQTGDNARLENVLKNDINPNSRCHGKTITSWAAEQGIPLYVSILLDRGADIDAQDDVSLMTPLLVATKLGHTSVVELLLDRGANTELRDHPDGRTALLYAAAQGHDEIVHLLLKRHADVNARDDVYGKTPLMWAAENSHINAVVALRDTSRRYIDR